MQGVKYETEEQRREARRASSRKWREKADRSQYYKEYYKNMSPEKKKERIEKLKARRETHGDLMRKQSRESYHRNKHKHTLSREYSMWKASRIRASKKKISHDIDLLDIVIPEFCPVFGIQLRKDNKTLEENSPTLDRIDPARGYVKGNVCVISWKANTIKSFGTAEEHRRIADYIDSFN